MGRASRDRPGPYASRGPARALASARRRPAGGAGDAAAAAMTDAVKLVPPIEKVRLKKLAATDGIAYVGVELEYHTTGGEPTRLEFGLAPDDAAALGANLAQLGEKLQSREH